MQEKPKTSGHRQGDALPKRRQAAALQEADRLHGLIKNGFQ